MDRSPKARKKRHDSESDSEDEIRKRIRHDSDAEDEEEFQTELGGQIDAKRRGEETLETMSEEDSGKNAKTVFRDSITGKKLDIDALKRTEKAKEEEKDKTLKMMEEWGAGLKQKEDREAALLRLEREKSKPLARYDDDEDMNQEMRENERFGDPMALYLAKKNKTQKKEKKKKKEKKEKKEKNEGNRKIKLPKEPRWKGFIAPGNRFNILPGTAWDGVDRSNGFESRLLRREGEKAALAETAYMWSVEDM